MRLLTDQELADVSAGYCPFCVATSIFLLASASSTMLGYLNKHISYYITGGLLLTLSAATSLKLYSNEKKPGHHGCENSTSI